MTPTIPPTTIAALLRKALEQGQTPSLAIISNSMKPLLQSGDKIWVESVELGALQAGDMVLVETPGELMTHRFWGSLSQNKQVCLITRGDRPLNFDMFWSSEKLIGRVIARQRGKQRLSFQESAGKRLNQRLTTLAQWEIKLFQPSLGSHDHYLQLPQFSPLWCSHWFANHRSPLLERIIRRLFYSWATILATITLLKMPIPKLTATKKEGIKNGF